MAAEKNYVVGTRLAVGREYAQCTAQPDVEDLPERLWRSGAKKRVVTLK